MAKSKPIATLRCAVKNYEWGPIGEGSHVARLAERNSGEDLDLARPYAEFWMGTHPSGPSYVAADGDAVSLKDWIRANPAVLGDKVPDKWGPDLPFLFKVLSVAKALSIQAHPDKKLAELLHKSRPDIYKDANHKPEMAVAITEFKALCGFVTAEEVKDVLATIPEVRELIGIEENGSGLIGVKDYHSCRSNPTENGNGFANKANGNGLSIEENGNGAVVGEESKTYLKSIFTTLMSASQDAVSNAIQKLKSRLNDENKIRSLTEKEQLILMLEQQYPGDVGVVSAFFFNYVKLCPGEALYIGANEPHAYIYGECIECMATSDNVVRAGLTPKFRDVPALCSMLTYKQGFPEILRGVPLNKNVYRYTPPFEEFEVDRCSLLPDEAVTFSPVPGPSIFLVLSGTASIKIDSLNGLETFSEGDVFFLSAHTEANITNAAAAMLVLFRAGVNERFFD
ncbi:hypothetical protein LUZ63_016310 [Rhynchospora breviuscula]|uniref:Mannose-6-phosphate isomerase n=1 Tax=Rhynchospora breviuscula TaxID=2022672 RepID=A0A9Q0C0A1_9POAL|nr:hypothetical protein LUZ63_016310 [Rhynchospora breviuscula]